VAVGGDYYPVGWWLSYSHVFVNRAGLMVANASGLVWELGPTPVAGLEMAVRAHRPLICLHSRPDQRAWPTAPRP
jgi:hypothetical protein